MVVIVRDRVTVIAQCADIRLVCARFIYSVRDGIVIALLEIELIYIERCDDVIISVISFTQTDSSYPLLTN